MISINEPQNNMLDLDTIIYLTTNTDDIIDNLTIKQRYINFFRENLHSYIKLLHKNNPYFLRASNNPIENKMIIQAVYQDNNNEYNGELPIITTDLIKDFTNDTWGDFTHEYQLFINTIPFYNNKILKEKSPPDSFIIPEEYSEQWYDNIIYNRLSVIEATERDSGEPDERENNAINLIGNINYINDYNIIEPIINLDSYNISNESESESESDIIKCPLCRTENNTDVIFSIKGNSDKCSICYENNVEHFFSKCGHACVCSSCFKQL